MKKGQSARVRAMYRELHTSNRLKKLKESDQEILWGYLFFFLHMEGPTTGVPVFSELEELNRLATQAQALAVEIDRLLINGNFATPLKAHARLYLILMAALRHFGEQLTTQVSALGKHGHKEATCATHFLVKASEFVKHRLGSYRDADLCHLLQEVDPQATLKKQFSPALVRKRRDHFRKTYPGFYAEALKEIADL